MTRDEIMTLNSKPMCLAFLNSSDHPEVTEISVKYLQRPCEHQTGTPKP